MPAVVALVYAWPAEAALPVDRVRWAGMLFQLVGVATVALGAWRLLRQFAPLPVADHLRRSIADRFLRFKFILFTPPATQVSITATDAADMAVGEATVAILKRDNATIDDRVGMLEKSVHDLSARFEKEMAKVRQELNERAKQLSAERQARERDGRDIKQIIEDASIGGIGLEFIGVFYLAIGIILASAPELVVSVLGW